LTKEWLKDLKVGDMVVVNTSGVGMRLRTAIVEKKTPSGRITLSNGYTYNPDGNVRGVKDSYFHSYILEPTDKVLNEIYQYGLYKKVHRLVMNKIEWQELSIEELEKALELLSPLVKKD